MRTGLIRGLRTRSIVVHMGYDTHDKRNSDRGSIEGGGQIPDTYDQDSLIQ